MRISVLFGGDSEERDVSVASAAQVIPALRSRGHDVHAVDTAFGALGPADEHRVLSGSVPLAPPTGSSLDDVRRRGGALRLPAEAGAADVVFLALHGGSGEDGKVQSLLDLAGIRYTGSGPLGSALAMDKDISKTLLRARGVLTPDWILVPSGDRSELGTRVIEEIGYPVVVKPVAQGSTVGLSVVRSGEELEDAVAKAENFGPVMIERFIRGRELTVGVLDDHPLAVGEIAVAPDEAFSYEDKYQPDAVEERFPAMLPEAVAEQARLAALAAHRGLRLDDYSRTDFRLDDAGRLWLIETNSLPGLTSTSLLPQSAAAAGIDYADLCERICLLALRRS